MFNERKKTVCGPVLGGICQGGQYKSGPGERGTVLRVDRSIAVLLKIFLRVCVVKNNVKPYLHSKEFIVYAELAHFQDTDIYLRNIQTSLTYMRTNLIYILSSLS